MEYTMSVGDVQESFEGTPEEIAELLMRKPERLKEMPIDKVSLVNYIERKLFEKDKRVNRQVLYIILELQEEYHIATP